MDSLLLLSGIDIPFPSATINIHQPTIKEIAFLSEPVFYKACSVLTFDKEKLHSEDKVNLEGLTNFDIIMSIMTERKDPRVRQQQTCVRMLFAILFPDYQINFTKNGIVLIKPEESEMHIISKQNFDEFLDILKEAFCLSGTTGKNSDDYNPAGDKAKEIAEKLRRGRELAAAAKGETNKEISILSRYASIIAVGNHKDLNDLMNYTIYQLYDEFGRYELKLSNDIYIQAKMAGAEGLQEVDNWMKDLHS